jgi:putative addiction module component (TIGR02574 family)
VAAKIQHLPFDQDFELVENIWNTIAVEQAAVPMTPEQKRELDNRLDAYRANRAPGHPASEVIEGICARL